MSETLDRKIVFRRMSEKDKFDALFEMVMNALSDSTSNKASVVLLQGTLNRMEGELEGIGYRKGGDSMTTTQKFNTEMDKRFSGWVWYRDKILAPSLATAQTIIILAILYLAFGGKVP